jgi:thioredoxin 1
MAVIDLQDATFDAEMSKSDELTVVDFWAPWCGPCRTVGPVIEELAEELEGQVRFVKVNVDEAQDVAQRFQVRSIPTLGFFKGGEAIGSIVGAYPKPALEQVIEQVQEKLAEGASPAA